ncbi:MAG: group 1 glycosyl transferase [Candidatus Gottesmanbacteria bacterium GW2011_GWA2_43_14]|uniref:Group 1 glycosyl transferase n=1 Tax=Candidatus Gottesmanbacteria bacterium GW2011_GWA2_43_14 TaxID=1618443 RepID=A0A0G1GIM5_9BACT|nr:MAG: group 1 glycosyl transferase [Candidatus Gottesmanbacteria bacterium GW2011_GWA2_43_14]
MIIGIDANEANENRLVGIGRYALELIKNLHLLLLNSHNAGIAVEIYLKDEPGKQLPPEKDFWRYRVFGPRFLWTQFALPWQLYTAATRPDIFFSTTHYAPRFSPIKTVVSVMDLSYLHFPETFLRKDLWQLKNWTDYSVAAAAKVITISKSSKADILKHYDIPEDKVEVVYPGINRRLFNDKKAKGEAEFIRRRYQLRGDYLLYVGTVQPRKNLDRLLNAFSRLYRRRPDLQLVIAGKKGWLYGEFLRKMDAEGIKKKLVFTGFVADADLPALYRQAKALVQPSLYEGFGIPVVEAMACGIPVAVSNTSSLPEVAAGAGLLFDPASTDDLARALETACYNEKVRLSLIRKGKERAAAFSWEKSSRKLLNILESVSL